MRKKNKFLAGIFVFFLILSFVSTGCYIEFSEDDDGSSTYDVTFTFTKSGVDGSPIYAMLTTDSTCSGAMAYDGSGTMNNGVFALVIEDIEEGTYTACALIDRDDSGDTPTSGDWVSSTEGGSPISIPDDGEFINIGESDWEQYSD